MKVPEWLRRSDAAVIGFVQAYSTAILRVTLGIVFVWFGILKMLGSSPVADLVAKTLYFMPPHAAVFGMGCVEVIIGIGLLTGWAMRLTLVLFFAQMVGTFFTMIVRPDLVFRDVPFKLGLNGEFIIKNLVLISAGLVILGTVRKARAKDDVADMLAEKAHTSPERTG